MWILGLKGLSDFGHSSEENTPDALGPHMFVQGGVYTDIWGPHHLFCKLLYFLDSPWSSSLESTVKSILHFNMHATLLFYMQKVNRNGQQQKIKCMHHECKGFAEIL